MRDTLLAENLMKFFGVTGQLAQSSTASIDAATANADPTKLVTLAKGLTAKVISASANLAPNIDQMALWPNDTAPTHIIACNEEGTAQVGMQRIRLSDGLIENILFGTTSCDPVRRTPWGTILAGEEGGTSGQMFEILNPLATTNVQFDRVAGTFTNGPGGSGAELIATRYALGRLSFEGLAIYPNGVTYYGDENRPGTGTAGGAYFKFIPTTPFSGGGPISNLADSPLVSGAVYGLRLGLRSGATDYGQGTQTGRGMWIPIPASFNANLRAQAASLKLTGYYRPEDADIDTAALAAGKVRFVGINTGNEGDDRNFGEALAITDGNLADATANTAIPEVQFLVVGTPGLAMPDNVARQPSRGNWILHEDGDGAAFGLNNDLWDCLDDGSDDDLLSDACIRVASLNDLTAEWTGGFWDNRGRLIVSVQHNISGHGVILAIEGWR
jgi:secreted PhoX family phosphatase